jgi:hypothetical protein
MSSFKAEKTWFHRAGVGVVTPAEVLEKARRDGRIPPASSATPPSTPRKDKNLPWYWDDCGGGRGVDPALVGENRCIMALAARKEACRAFGISKYDLPHLRFASHPPIGAPDDMGGWFQPSLSGGTVCVLRPGVEGVSSQHVPEGRAQAAVKQRH